ncbi:multiple C2 and transmembrane domain-containing protein 2 [Hibiscus syriacus]|uniref:TBCC domain-containing protein 1 n=1 Tax=Hibiscus syriacus TaxID=106335 RepID=A0A6A3AHZ8_HIBSY|nr:multiple C2 and transmembrane domain-containing protein 2 [Hibiscus syriacus]
MSVTIIQPRREPFENGLLPIQKLIFNDPVEALTPLKLKFASSTQLVDSEAVSELLQISSDHVCLVIETLASVLHSETDPLVATSPDDVDSVACLSNSRRFMPSPADEEAHQLSYLQKHLANILFLLSEPVEGEGEESLVLTTEGFEYLGFLIQFDDKGSEAVPLSQAAPFFANSDPDMPAVPVTVSQVHDWLLQTIASSLERVTEKASAKENGPSFGSDQDVTMTDASPRSAKASPSARSPFFIEGVSKSSYVKQASDINNSSVKVINCHDSTIYILAPLRYVVIYGCSDATIVLGAVGKAVRVEHCERVHVIIAAKRVCIANCREWDEALPIGVVDPHDSLSHPAGVSDARTESTTRLDPDQFTNFLIPNWFEAASTGSTKDNPFPLPDAYLTSQLRNQNNLSEIKQILREAPLEDNRKKRAIECSSCVLQRLVICFGKYSSTVLPTRRLIPQSCGMFRRVIEE